MVTVQPTAPGILPPGYLDPYQLYKKGTFDAVTALSLQSIYAAAAAAGVAPGDYITQHMCANYFKAPAGSCPFHVGGGAVTFDNIPPGMAFARDSGLALRAFENAIYARLGFTGKGGGGGGGGGGGPAPIYARPMPGDFYYGAELTYDQWLATRAGGAQRTPQAYANYQRIWAILQTIPALPVVRDPVTGAIISGMGGHIPGMHGPFPWSDMTPEQAQAAREAQQYTIEAVRALLQKRPGGMAQLFDTWLSRAWNSAGNGPLIADYNNPASAQDFNRLIAAFFVAAGKLGVADLAEAAFTQAHMPKTIRSVPVTLTNPQGDVVHWWQWIPDGLPVATMPVLPVLPPGPLPVLITPSPTPTPTPSPTPTPKPITPGPTPTPTPIVLPPCCGPECAAGTSCPHKAGGFPVALALLAAGALGLVVLTKPRSGEP